MANNRKGRQDPTQSFVLPYKDTQGPVAVKYYKKTGRMPHEWQEVLIYDILIEAINNKIKLTIRMAYGFRNINSMMDMIMLRCSNIEVKLPWETQTLTHAC